ncbi:class I SAM-dependent methyltransferase [Hyphococcus sp.]|uniref:class I SAM-dependent methyltransferase n=1 Tax=Hyphococcus sp. TaxID=2038636 RepID=UPI003752CDEF
MANFRAAALFAVWMAACTPAPAPEQASEPATAEADSDELNLDLWLERMEVGSRELYSARDEVVNALGLKPGDSIADIGAGTGLYTLLFAEAIGPTGRVYAEDIESLFLELINQRADDAGAENITAVLGRENDVTLPANSIDIVFIADTYHYFGDRETVMKSVLRALKPGGSLVLVDYDLKPGEERPADKEHVRFGKAGVISEIEYIGFKLADDVEVPGLEENYFLRFVKPQ